MINHNNHIFEGKMQSCEEYVKRLEEEKEKIQVFRRELPLCLELATEAIEACKQQLSRRTKHFHGESGSDEQLVSSQIGPMTTEYFPIHSNLSDLEKSQCSHQQNNTNNEKSEWLKSVQLWNQCPGSPTKVKEDSPRRVSFVEVNGNHYTSSCAFHPFHRESKDNSIPQTTKCLSLIPEETRSSSPVMGGNGGQGNKDEKESKGKTRRSWSAELHRRFLHALQQLGGSHVATPKQIRDIMKVDGLTNDEVKSHLQVASKKDSHLQKYRLHERRPTSSSSNNHEQTQAPQIMVVGGIWVPPPEYAVVTTMSMPDEASRAANKVYAPVAIPPPRNCFDELRRFSNNRVNASSSATSTTTTHATTAT